MLAGGLGGVAYWGPVYPADVIKSRMQVDDLRSPTYRGMLDCFTKVEISVISCFKAGNIVCCPQPPRESCHHDAFQAIRRPYIRSAQLHCA